MTHLNGGEPAFPYPGSHKPDLEAVVAEARRLVEGTTQSQHAIAQQLKVSASVISVWKKKWGWVRPDGAPVAPPEVHGFTNPKAAEQRREILLGRLYRVFDRQLKDVESRVANAMTTTDEKDARTLGTLARTLGTLMALQSGGGEGSGRHGGAEADEPEKYDPDEIRARLAERLAGLSPEDDT
jgi:transposase